MWLVPCPHPPLTSQWVPLSPPTVISYLVSGVKCSHRVTGEAKGNSISGLWGGMSTPYQFPGSKDVPAPHLPPSAWGIGLALTLLSPSCRGHTCKNIHAQAHAYGLECKNQNFLSPESFPLPLPHGI